MKPLCFVLMPFGKKVDGRGRTVDFDAVYKEIIAPAVERADLTPIRADEEQVGGAIHKPMFERLMLCDYAIADVTGANPNVYYELGIRHALRPRSTLIVFAEGSVLPFDISPLRGLPYGMGEDGRPKDAPGAIGAIAGLLQAARRDPHDDSPLFQLVEGMPRVEIDHAKTDVFRQQVEYSQACKAGLAQARASGPGASQAIAEFAAENGLDGDLTDVESGVAVDLMLSYRAAGDFQRMAEVVDRMSEPLRRTRLVREQRAFAFNRLGRRREAEDILRAMIDQYGPSSETNGLLGRIYKDQYGEADKAGNQLAARGFLKKAISAYVAGFEADWRDAYPGVNAVTLMEMQDPVDPRQAEIIPVVRYSAARRAARGGDYWDHATLAELAVLARDREGAMDAMASALAQPNPEAFWYPTTADNLSKIVMVRRARGEDVGWITELEDYLRASAAAQSGTK